jgi:methyl-accepting chemotaxis protein
MAYNFTIHKIASGTVPWTQFYHNYVQAVQDAVNALDAAVNTNTANISLGGTAIGTNTADIATNTANIILGATAIGTNTADIATNTADIATNTTNIAANTIATATNATNIAANITNIATNTADIATNTTNIAANTIATSTNAINIADNIATLTTHTTQLNNGGVLLTEHSTRLNETLTYTYVERIAGVRTSTLGVHTYITTDARLAIIQAKLDFIMDTLKQLNVPYLDDSLTVVPATTPNP